MMSRTVRRGQHDKASRAEGGVTGFAGLELFRLAVDGGYVAQ